MLSEVQNNIGLPYVFQSTFSKVYLISESALLANPYTLSLSPSPSKIYFFCQACLEPIENTPQHCEVGGVDLVHLRVLFLTLQRHENGF